MIRAKPRCTSGWVLPIGVFMLLLVLWAEVGGGNCGQRKLSFHPQAHGASFLALQMGFENIAGIALPKAKAKGDK